MARRKKRKNLAQQQNIVKKGTEALNQAFKGLTSLKIEDKTPEMEPEKQEEATLVTEPDENQYFFDAMSGVEPLKGPGTKIISTPNIDIRPSHPAPDDELETMTRLSDLVSGTAEMDITFSDEYIEGCVRGFSKKLMQKLKKGRFPVQDYVDLHGLTKNEAKIRLSDFLFQSCGAGLRCVLVVHGRGLNSENNIPVLKEQLPIWLSRGSIKKTVLAFSTSMPYDGGTGAVYILLRKREKIIY